MPVIEEKDEFKIVIPYQEVAEENQGDSQSDSLHIAFNHLTQRQIAILSVIQSDSHVTVSMIATKLKVSVATIHRELKKINAHIQVHWTGPSVGGQWKILTP